ncbi:MAG: hypothetical protein HPM95_10960 [Alphaproteobacteria bacterium]|nr:hypothetical protein [Alphaproteobacteria bacterium]
MKAILDERQARHDPKHFMSQRQGVRQSRTAETHPGSAAGRRALAAGCDFAPPKDHGAGPIAAIHSAEYLVFLEGPSTPAGRG